MIIRISLDKLQKRIDCSIVSKNDWSLETIHGHFEHHHYTTENFVLVGSLICSDAWEKVTQSEASANGDVISYVFCSRTTDTSDKPSNDTMMFIQSIFNSIWT